MMKRYVLEKGATMLEHESGEWVRAVDVPSADELVLKKMGYQELGRTCKDCDNFNRYNGECELVPFLNLKVDGMTGRCEQIAWHIPEPAVEND
jgi:hypothetical protein